MANPGKYYFGILSIIINVLHNNEHLFNSIKH